MKLFRKFILPCIILTAGAIICAIRWNAWFYNEPEQDYIVSHSPSNIVMTMGETPSERYFSWRTDSLLPSFLLLDGDTIPAIGKIVTTRAGKAAYYSAYVSGLKKGLHTYFVQTDSLRSNDYSFYLRNSNNTHFVLFGDIQATSDTSSFAQTIKKISATKTDFIGYVGDIINAQTDDSWQIWFRAVGRRAAILPQEAVPGNHEYLKGLFYHPIDSRWTSVFQNPQNGSHRQLGTSYYIDFPHLRYIVFNTQDLHCLSDYTIASSWLFQTIEKAGDKWTVVVMHHSVYSAAMDRVHPAMYFFYKSVLEKADVVIAGHDHSYMRYIPNTVTNEKTNQEYFTTPVYMVTSSSDKHYLPKCSEQNQRLGSNRAFYEEVNATDKELTVTTYLMPSNELYDQFTISRKDRVVRVNNNLSDEILEVPERYINKKKASVNRANTRIRLRQETYKAAE